MILDEIDFASAVSRDDRDALAQSFVRVTRWVIRNHVNRPGWMDWTDLVQTGVMYCFKALPSYHGPKALPYFAEVVKRELRHVVRRACRTGEGTVAEPFEAQQWVDIGSIVYRTDASAHFPDDAQEFVDQVQSGRSGSLKDFRESAFGVANRRRVATFLTMLIAELKVAA